MNDGMTKQKRMCSSLVVLLFTHLTTVQLMSISWLHFLLQTSCNGVHMQLSHHCFTDCGVSHDHLYMCTYVRMYVCVPYAYTYVRTYIGHYCSRTKQQQLLSRKGPLVTVNGETCILTRGVACACTYDYTIS